MPDEAENIQPQETQPQADAELNAPPPPEQADPPAQDPATADTPAAVPDDAAQQPVADESAAAAEPAVAASPDELPSDGAAAGEPEASARPPDEMPTDTAAVGEPAAPAEMPPGVAPFDAPDLAAQQPTADIASIDLLDDVELDVKIELGRTEMYIEDVLGLGVGSVVALDKAAGDPVDIFVNERLVARGEVLVLNDNFCVRVNDILSPIPELEREQ